MSSVEISSTSTCLFRVTWIFEPSPAHRKSSSRISITVIVVGPRRAIKAVNTVVRNSKRIATTISYETTLTQIRHRIFLLHPQRNNAAGTVYDDLLLKPSDRERPGLNGERGGGPLDTGLEIRRGGTGGDRWALASSGDSLGVSSSQRSSLRRRVELRTPAEEKEEEAIRKASYTPLAESHLTR